jgi:hypothetical protein
MHRVDLLAHYWFCVHMASPVVVIERVTLAEFRAVRPLLERFFAEEGFDNPQAQIGEQLVELIEGCGSAVLRGNPFITWSSTSAEKAFRRAGGLCSLHLRSQSAQAGQMIGRKRKRHE